MFANNNNIVKMERKRKNLSQTTLDKQIIKRSKKTVNTDELDGSCLSEAAKNGRAGRVLRILLKNFMCHSSLEINFKTNANYIIGRNGSGKSAVLTALVVGLGGKARLTNRGSNMKSFIKVGESCAIVEITLSNCGVMAYEPDVYGDYVTLIRSFYESGGNSYKLKSSQGEIITTKFSDVCRLIDALNIHVENPICILNQDTSRTFLNTSDPEKMYIMYMRATNLENVRNEYKTAAKNKQANLAVLENKKATLAMLEKEVQKWCIRLEAFDLINDLEDKKKKLQEEAVWAQVSLVEEEVNEKSAAVDAIKEEIAKLEDMIKNKSGHVTELERTRDEISSKLLEIRNEEEANQRLLEKSRAHVNSSRDTCDHKRTALRKLQHYLTRKRDDQHNIEQEITNSSDNHGRRMKVIQEIEREMCEKEREMRDVSRVLQTSEHELQQLRAALEHARLQQRNAHAELAEKEARLKQKVSRIRAMRADENSCVNVYGGGMTRVLQAVHTHKEQFVHLPKGPLGSYIKLKDKKWALAIENFISSGTLMSFCVDNQKDAKLLERIFRDVFGNQRKPTIISSKFYNKVHDVSRHKVHAPNGCVSMLDAMVIEEAVISNCLIDQLSVETVLLIPSNELARELMSLAARVPSNCSRAVTLAGDQFYPDPNYRTYSCRSKAAKYLQVSASEAIHIEEEEVKVLRGQMTDIGHKAKNLTTEATKLTADVNSIQNKIQDLFRAQNKTQRELDDLKLRQPPPEPNLQILSDELEEIKRMIEKAEADVQQVEGELQKVEEEVQKAEAEQQTLKLVSRGLEDRMRPLLEQMNEADRKLQTINRNARFNGDKVRECKERLQEANIQLERKRQMLQERLADTERLGMRQASGGGRRVEHVLAELQRVTEQLEDTRAHTGDRQHAVQHYTHTYNQYDGNQRQLEQISACMNEMVTTVEKRGRHYQRLSEYIDIRVQDMFTGVLKIRQFKGTMEINHERKILRLMVIPEHGSAAGSGNTHILSGGERSFSTIAFLHSLWQVMDFPFYFLDEFDVFMDKVNRRVVMDLLMGHAKEHSQLQYVFLTPQDISSVKADEDITIHRMQDPR